MTRTPAKPAKPAKPAPAPSIDDPYIRAARKFPALKAQATERLSRRAEGRGKPPMQ